MNRGMKNKKGGSKKKDARSPEPNMEADQDDCDTLSPSTNELKNQRASASREVRHVISEDEIEDIQQDLRKHDTEGAPRPREGGYRGPDPQRRLAPEWGDNSPMPYGQTSNSTYRGTFRQPWSPNSYGGGRKYDGRPVHYGGRPTEYDGRSDFVDRRDPYYDSRGRDFDRRGREYEEHLRYEEGKYDRRPPLPSHMYAHGIDPTAANQYSWSSMLASSPPPSSLANLTNDVNVEARARRPLHLEKSGIPSGKMASLLHGDIVSFVKDMDPTTGWEGQTKDAKERLHDRLIHDYEVYGDSTRLSEKYLRKEAGAALIQYRFTLNENIDRGYAKRADLRQEYWNALKERRESKEAKARSLKMATIARGRGSKNSSKKSLEQSVLVKLTLELKREPYNSELQEAVEKKWAALQEETAEKKRQKAVVNASTAATLASKDLDRRLEVIEAFVQKWEPQFDMWKKMVVELHEAKFPDYSTRATVTRKQVALLAIEDKSKPTTDVEEGQTLHTSDEEESSDKSKSYGVEESDSEEEKNTSQGEKSPVDHLHPTNVVEPNEETDRKITTKKAMAVHASLPLSKPTTVMSVGAKSTVVEPKSAVDLQCPTKKGGFRQPLEVMGKGKQPMGTLRTSSRTAEKAMESTDQAKDCKAEAEKDRDPESRSAKRLKLDSHSADELVVLDEEATLVTAQKPECPGKPPKIRRKNTKGSQVKVDNRGGKGKTSVATEVWLLENSEPRKLLGVGHVVHLEFDRDRVPMLGQSNMKLVRLLLKRVTHPDAPLAFVQVDGEGKLECSTLGQAFVKQCLIWWPAPLGLE